MRIYSKAIPKGFKSEALANALKNLGQLPLQLGRFGSVLTGTIKRNLGGRILQRRSGKLQDSWEWTITAANAGWRLEVGSDVVYARIQNFGGWSGKNHRTRIRPHRYVEDALRQKKAQLRRILADYWSKLTLR